MEASEEDIHPHCMQCIKHLKCTVVPKPGLSCKIITCSLNCGARFHACKLKEHKILCMNERVPCINVEYGCPALMLRKKRGAHLISCPASVIHCSEEWDRWPIHIHDKKEDHSFQDLVAEGHLDVALAMRDQRMLHRWCMAAQQRRTLKDQNFKINPSSCLWIFKKWQSSREQSYPPGLEQSVCNELCRTCSKSLNATLNSISYTNAQVPILGFSVEDLHTSYKNSTKQENKDSNQNPPHEVCDAVVDIAKETLSPNSDTHNHAPDDRSIFPKYNLDDVLLLSQLNWITYDPSTNEGYVRYSYGSDIASTASACSNHQNLACQILDFKFRNPSSTPPWCLSLGLDLNLESRSQHQASNFMYTFLCCKEFRRDEYGWHYKNVHSEIHSGLNGWFLERCPLAQYGCKFARKRFNPSKESFVIYNETLESFGVTMHDRTVVKNGLEREEVSKLKESESRYENLNLTFLPFHVLQKITGYLDSFSMCNLALTCTLLRDVCSTLLENRGLVLLKWEKVKENDRYCWKISNNKRWFFSSCFTPIHKWTFDDTNNMANHLKSCQYFKPIVQGEAFNYVVLKNILVKPMYLKS